MDPVGVVSAEVSGVDTVSEAAKERDGRRGDVVVDELDDSELLLVPDSAPDVNESSSIFGMSCPLFTNAFNCRAACSAHAATFFPGASSTDEGEAWEFTSVMECKEG